MRVLDLFSGLGGWSKAFKDRNHEVITIDAVKEFNPSVVIDINKLDVSKLEDFDIILASPPCAEFSKSSMPDSWNKNRTVNPDTRLLLKTMDIIKEVNPKYWIIENVRGAVPFFKPITGKPVKRVGSRYLWGNFPIIDVKDSYGKERIPPIKNRPALRSLIPYNLSLAVCKAVENELDHPQLDI